MASSTDFKKLYELYQMEGVKKGSKGGGDNIWLDSKQITSFMSGFSVHKKSK